MQIPVVSLRPIFHHDISSSNQNSKAKNSELKNNGVFKISF